MDGPQHPREQAEPVNLAVNRYSRRSLLQQGQVDGPGLVPTCGLTNCTPTGSGRHHRQHVLPGPDRVNLSPAALRSDSW